MYSNRARAALFSQSDPARYDIRSFLLSSTRVYVAIDSTCGCDIQSHIDFRLKKKQFAVNLQLEEDCEKFSARERYHCCTDRFSISI